MDKEKLKWGKPCIHGHQHTDGTNLRAHHNCLTCIGLKENRPWASLPQDEMYELFLKPHRNRKHEDQSPEAIAKRKSEASARWNKKNKEHYTEIQTKYRKSEHGKAKAKEKRLAKYHSMPVDEKEKLLEGYRQYNKAKYANMTPEQVEAHKQKCRDYSKAKYDAMSPEERTAYNRKAREVMKARYKQSKMKDTNGSQDIHGSD